MTRGEASQQPLSLSTVGAAAGTAQLRIMETTDLHVHLAPYDYYADRPAPHLGLVRLSELIDRARAEVSNTVLFDNGDFLQGTPMGDYIAYDRGLRAGEAHPVIAAMNALKFDAITLGNHEFNYGLDFLLRAIERSDCPVVTTNLLRAKAAQPRRDQSLTRPYALLDRVIHDALGHPYPIRIGVIGVAPPQVTRWERQALEGRVWSRGIVEAARAWLPELREAGADIVVALAHTGLGHPGAGEDAENAAIALAQLDGIDALLVGHSHMVFPGPGIAASAAVDPHAGTICGKPAVMAGFWGSHLGVIDLLLQRDGGSWRVLGSRAEARPLAQLEPGERAWRARYDGARPGAVTAPAPRAPAVRRTVRPLHDETLTALRKPLGATQIPLHSFFAMLGRSSAVALVAEAQQRRIRERLAGTPLADLPVISAVAPFKAGGHSGPGHYTDIPPGPLALRHVSDLYAFPNALAALCLTGAEVRLWLERSASAFNRLAPWQKQGALLNPLSAPYAFETLFGLDYCFDLSCPPRFDLRTGTAFTKNARVRSVTLRGAPLADDDRVLVCTNTFRANGAGGFAGTGPDRIVHCEGETMLELLRRHLAARGSVKRVMPSPLHLAPIPGGRAVLSTGPGAAAHLDDVRDLAPQVQPEARNGFLELTLDFTAPRSDSRAPTQGG